MTRALSGNRNISCGTCHNPATGTSDAVALSIGEGGRGQGRERQNDEGVTGRVPRNAQSLYNLGALEYRSFFHDGRLNASSTHVHGAGFTSPDSERLPNDPPGLLARQALFPVTSAVEMAGQPGENPVAEAVARYQLSGTDGAWDLIAERLRELPDYVTLFRNAFDEVVDAEDLTYAHVAEALAAFQAEAFRSTGSRFDQLLETRQTDRWSETERQGLALFYGKAGCSDCHAGSYDSLEDVVRHHLDPIASLESYSRERAERTLSPLLNVLDSMGRGSTRLYYPLDATRLVAFNHRRGFVQESDTLRSRIDRHNDLSPVRLQDDEVDALIAFLHTLTDPESSDQSHLIPRHLPSGLEPQPMPMPVRNLRDF